MASAGKDPEPELDFMEDLANYKPTELLREIVKQKEEILDYEVDINNLHQKIPIKIEIGLD